MFSNLTYATSVAKSSYKRCIHSLVSQLKLLNINPIVRAYCRVFSFMFETLGGKWGGLVVGPMMIASFATKGGFSTEGTLRHLWAS